MKEMVQKEQSEGKEWGVKEMRGKNEAEEIGLVKEMK